MKSRRRRRDQDIVKPTAERRRHGLIERATDRVVDSSGLASLPFRAPGTLDVMLRAGTISRPAHLAGLKFHQDFVLAALDPIAAADPTRLPVLVLNGARTEALQGSERARAQIRRALAALGGPNSQLGACAWNVLGREMSLREYANHRGWNHRPPSFTAGILVCTLDMLQIHYDSRHHDRGG